MSLQTENFALQSNRRRAQIPARHVADTRRRTAPLPARHYCVSRAISLTSVWSLRPLSPRLETTRGAPRPLALPPPCLRPTHRPHWPLAVQSPSEPPPPSLRPLPDDLPHSELARTHYTLPLPCAQHSHPTPSSPFPP